MIGYVSTRMTLGRWSALGVGSALAALLVSLAFPVDASSMFGTRTPSCGAPLVHGVDFNGSASTVDVTDLASWQASPACGEARAERLVSNATLTGVLLVAFVTLIVLWRARRRLLDSGDALNPGAGIVAAFINPLVGPLVGLIFARQPGTRRMLATQITANLGLALALGVLVLGSSVDSNLGGFHSDFRMGIGLGAFLVMGSLSLAFPISLLLGTRKPQRQR